MHLCLFLLEQPSVGHLHKLETCARLDPNMSLQTETAPQIHTVLETVLYTSLYTFACTFQSDI